MVRAWAALHTSRDSTSRMTNILGSGVRFKVRTYIGEQRNKSEVMRP
jgi:hypothetical protein